VLIRHLWQHKTVVFVHWCLIRAVLLKKAKSLSVFVCGCSTVVKHSTSGDEIKGSNRHKQKMVDRKIVYEQ
jgi:hypothetical protein